MAFHNDIGHFGEEATCRYLQDRGYKIVERNWRLGYIEIDIIAENDEYVAFVEVKTRTTRFADVNPEQYVDEHKKKFMTVAGNGYMKHNQITKLLRFDISGVLWNKDTNQVEEIRYYENAFRPKVRDIHNGTFNGQWKWHRR